MIEVNDPNEYIESFAHRLTVGQLIRLSRIKQDQPLSGNKLRRMNKGSNQQQEAENWSLWSFFCGNYLVGKNDSGQFVLTDRGERVFNTARDDIISVAIAEYPDDPSDLELDSEEV